MGEFEEVLGERGYSCSNFKANVPVAPPVTTATRPLTVKRSAAARDGAMDEDIITVSQGDEYN